MDPGQHTATTDTPYAALDVQDAAAQSAPACASLRKNRRIAGCGCAAALVVVAVLAILATTHHWLAGAPSRQSPDDATQQTLVPMSTGFNVVTGAPASQALLATSPSTGRRRLAGSQLVDVAGKPVPASCLVDNTQTEDASVSSHLFTSVESYASSLSESLGLSFGYGFFSASAKLEHVRQNTFSSSTQRYYAQAKRSFQLQRVSCGIEGTQPSAAFRKAVAALPPSYNDTDAHRTAWLSFVSQTGTHFVKSTTYGGHMLMSVLIDTTLMSSAGQSSDQVVADVSYGAFSCGLGGSVSHSVSSAQMQQFSDHSSDQELHVVGGDVTAKDWQTWQSTLESKPGVIAQQLGSMSELFEQFFPDQVQNVRAATHDYLHACPSSPINPSTPCSGRGTCDWRSRACVCDQGYAGDRCEQVQCPSNPSTGAVCSDYACDTSTGKCQCPASRTGSACESMVCPVDPDTRLVCGGHGTCDGATGTCKCKGEFKGFVCTTPCGQISTAEPMHDGVRVDHCLEHGRDCSAVDAASRWCVLTYGFEATLVSVSTDTPAVGETVSLDDYSYCHAELFGSCNAISDAVCGVPCV